MPRDRAHTSGRGRVAPPPWSRGSHGRCPRESHRCLGYRVHANGRLEVARDEQEAAELAAKDVRLQHAMMRSVGKAAGKRATRSPVCTRNYIKK